MIGLILLSTVFSLIFALIVYTVGYYGGNKFISKLCYKYNRCGKSIDKCRLLFNRYSKISVFLGRMIPFSRIYISLIAGACKLDLFSYVFFSLFGIFLWNAIIVCLGFSLFINLDYLSQIYENGKLLILIIISASIIIIITWKNKNKKG